MTPGAYKDAKEAQPKAGQAQPGPPMEGGRGSILAFMRRNPLAMDLAIFLLLAALAGGFLYWQDIQSKIYIEKAEITAPIISLSPQVPGQIGKFYVQEGDRVSQSQRLVEVGEETITAKTSGMIIWVLDSPGQLASPQQPVVKMIDPREFRVVGRIQEDKGLSEIRAGQKVVFTVDAFGSRQYSGVVESVGESARQSDIVFSISGKREEREFDVEVMFDPSAYPELKNGMSAKMWVYK